MFPLAGGAGVAKVILALLSIPRMSSFTTAILDGSYHGVKKSSLDALLTSGVSKLRTVDFESYCDAVRVVDQAMYGPDKGASREFVKSMLVRGKYESLLDFETRTTDVILSLEGRIAISLRSLFIIRGLEARRDGELLSVWATISRRIHNGQVDPRFPLIVKPEGDEIDPRLVEWGGTSGGYQPLEELKYYSDHYRWHTGKKVSVKSKSDH